jgi:TP901 family phage tail tape measure protein
MASTVVVQTTFKLNDRVTAALGRMGIRAEQTGDRATRAFRRSSRAASRFGAVVKGVLVAGVIQRGFAALSMGMRAVTTEFIDFDEAVTRAAAKFPDGIKRGTAAFKELQDAARATGATTEFTATQAAGALQAYAQAGFEAEQAMALLAGTTDLATSANVEMDQAAQIAVDSMGAFNLRTKDTAQATINMTRVTDVLAKTANSASLDIELLFETISTAGSVTQLGGASIETFSALAGKLADSANKGSISATTLKNVFLRLAAPVGKGERMLKKLRIEVADSNGDMRDMIDILNDVREATADMGSRQKSAALDVIFGKRAIAGANILLNQSDEALRSYRDSLIASGGASKEMADNIRLSVGNRLKVLKSTLIEVGFKFIDAFVRDGEGGLEKLIEAIRKFDMKPVIDAAKSALKWTKWFLSVLWDMRDTIATLVKLWVAYKVALMAITAIEAVITIIKLARAIGAAAKAQGLLNLIMAANPIFAVIAAITALVAAIYYLYNNWDTVVGWMEDIWVGFQAVYDIAIDEMADHFIRFSNIMQEQLNLVKAALITLWEETKQVFDKISDSIVEAISPSVEDPYNKVILEAMKEEERKVKLDPTYKPIDYSKALIDPEVQKMTSALAIEQDKRTFGEKLADNFKKEQEKNPALSTLLKNKN